MSKCYLMYIEKTYQSENQMLINPSYQVINDCDNHHLKIQIEENY